MVVNYNEARHLPACLKSLTFCEQLLFIDLGSIDDSVEIAKHYGAEVIHHARVPIVEEIRDEVLRYARNDWIILADPDEVFPSHAVDQLRLMIDQDPKLGSISIPWQFYFKKRPLHYTIWGMKKTKEAVVHKKRNRFHPNVHRGIQLLQGYNRVILPRKPEYMIIHYWLDSYHQLLEKHWRYIKGEGASRYRVGERFSWRRWAIETIAAFKRNLFDYEGIRGGLLGVFLSGFYSWYVAMSLLSLRGYQKVAKLR